MTQEEKLKMFFDISMDDAGKENTLLVDEYRNKLDEMYVEHVNEATKRAESGLKHRLETYRREKNAEISNKQMDKRRENSQVKNNYIEDIFSKVEERLMHFKKTPEYKELLISQIKKAFLYKDDNEMTVYIDASDEMYKDELVNMFDCNITVSESKIIGGIRADIPKKNISFDDSFASRISEARRKFIF